MDDKHDPSMQPFSGATFDDGVGLLSNSSQNRVRIATAVSPPAYYQGLHSRGNSSFDIGESPYDVTEPPTPQKERGGPSGPSSATSMLRKLTTKVNPMSRAHFRSTKRSQGRQYATLEEGDYDSPTVDLSSLEGMGWELTDMSGQGETNLQGQQTQYAPTKPTGGKPAFKDFVDKRRSVGEGMRDIGVQLRRDPTKLVRRSSAQRNGNSSGIDRTKTVREFGQNLAQEKNMIVEVEEPVDLSVLEGGQPDNRASQMFDNSQMTARNSMMAQETKSYFFPEDPDIPNWKPWSMSQAYILALIALALGLAGFQEYLYQRSQKEAKNGGGLLAFNQVAEISIWDFFAWKCECLDVAHARTHAQWEALLTRL